MLALDDKRAITAAARNSLEAAINDRVIGHAAAADKGTAGANVSAVGGAANLQGQESCVMNDTVVGYAASLYFLLAVLINVRSVGGPAFQDLTAPAMNFGAVRHTIALNFLVATDIGAEDVTHDILHTTALDCCGICSCAFIDLLFAA
ncbi:hypothetical protein ACIQUS_26305 [Pseudomonas sp. NPDC090755]|uniref:hypothetical protein n=1 Tax=Pseudomonas sp. NPDC090755 TaxID=3364481 RepID=UPI00383A719D